jgi:DNA-binding NarL/FixJ family response regulator
MVTRSFWLRKGGVRIQPSAAKSCAFYAGGLGIDRLVIDYVSQVHIQRRPPTAKSLWNPIHPDVETCVRREARRRNPDVYADSRESREKSPKAVLSPREREVALMIARGFSNKEIARDLDLSVGTVKLHVHRAENFLQSGARQRYVLVQLGSARSNLHTHSA